MREAQIEEDTTYETKAARYADVGYHAWNKGEMLWTDKATIEQIKELDKPSLHDEYVFVNKYWGKAWAMYALGCRLLILHNPMTEINAFRKAAKTKRINPFKFPIERSDYHQFQSSLVAQQPLVAVIIPTLNRYQYLRDVLHDLEQQEYKNFEVIIVDQSQPFEEDFYKHFHLKLQVIRQKEKLLWAARNNAIKSTTAGYLLFFDDDSRVEPDWITQHLKCLDYFDCEISAGVSLARIGMKVPESYSYFRWADQFDSGNAMVKRDVFKKIGLFDEQYNKQRMGDGEFGVRAYLNGYRSISNPFAKRIHLKVAEGGLREIGSWDGYRPKKWFAPKPVPSVVFLYKKYFPQRLYRNRMLLGIILSNVPYKSKGSKNMLAISLLLSVIKSPLLLIQFLKARSIANKMLRKDDGIQFLQS